MITKELFVSAMEEIVKEREKTDKFNNALCDVCDGFPVIELGNGYLNALIKVLNAYFSNDGNGEYDKYNTGWIDWWLFDNVEKKVWVQIEESRAEIDVTDAGDFYDFLMSRKEMSNTDGD